MFCGSLPSLLINQVEVAKSRLLVRLPFKEPSLGCKLVRGRNGIVAGAGNVSRSVFGKLIFAELKEADIRTGALLGIKIGFDLGNRFHKVEIKTENVSRTLDLLKGRSNRDIPYQVENCICRLLVRRELGKNIVNEIREIWLCGPSIEGIIAEGYVVFFFFFYA